MKFSIHILILIAMFLSNAMLAQNVSINSTGALPDSSAMLDVSDTASGFLMPRLNTSQMNAILNPAEGLMIYNTDSNGFYFFDGTFWVGSDITSFGTDTLDENHLTARIQGDGSIISQNVNWIQSITISSAGTFDITFVSGVFTVEPAITATVGGSTGGHNAAVNGLSVTGVTIQITNSSGTAANKTFALLASRQGSDYKYNTAGGSATGSINAFDSTRIADADNDTKIQVEQSADDDIIRFEMAGTEFFRMDSGRIEVINPNNSVSIGNNAGTELISNASAFQNVAVGNYALQGSAGRDNVAVGFYALPQSTSSAVRENTAIGMSSMQNLTTGYHNTAVGRASLSSLTSGYNNTAIGRNTLFGNNGYQNVALGNQAGHSTTGSQNVFIGNQAGTGQTGSDLLFIENTNSTTPLIWGDFANDSIKIYGNLSIGDEFSFPSTDGTSGQVLTTDGSGGVTWQAPSGDGNGIYDGDGSLSGNTTVSQGTNTLALTSSANNAFSVDGTTFSVDAANNRVGIGTTSPTQPLEVRGTAYIRRGTSSIGILLDSYSGGPLYKTETIIFSGTNSLTLGVRQYSTGASITATDRLFIISPKIGVSASSSFVPDSLFDVDGSASIDRLNINGAYTFPTIDGTSGQMLQTNGSGVLTWTSPSGSDDLGNHIATQNIQLNGKYLSGDGGNEGIFVSSDGDVGIGTNTPSSTLEIYKSGGGSYFRVQGTGDGFNYSGFELKSDEAVDKTYSFLHRKVGGEENSFLIEYFNGTNYYQRMVIDSSGNVGIGTNNPTATLSVNGSQSMKISTVNLSSAGIQNNISIPDDACVVRLTGTSGNTDITGIGAKPDGRVLYLINRTGNDLDLLHNNVGSSTSNRFLCVNESSMTLKPNATIQLIYSSSDSRWLVLSNKN